MNYEDIFAERGGAYHDAMRRWPDARREDFLVPLAWAALGAGERVVDVPAGGGYLAQYVPAGCQWTGHEPCATFSDGHGAQSSDLLPLPFADGVADCVISVAGVHHLDDKRPLFAECRRVVADGGRFVLADVHADSDVAAFLDGYVGAHNTTGHSGRYLGPETLVELTASGFSVERDERVGWHWWFRDRAELGAFCRLLFDIRAQTPEEVAAVVESRLGLVERDGRLGMNWELYLCRARPL